MIWNGPSVPLRDLPSIWPQDSETLAENGVLTSSDLTVTVRRDDGVEALGRRTGIPLEVLSDYHLVAIHEENKRQIRRRFNIGSLICLPLLGIAGISYAISQHRTPTACELRYGTFEAKYQELKKENSQSLEAFRTLLKGIETALVKDCADLKPEEVWMRLNLEQLKAVSREEEILLSLQNMDLSTFMSGADDSEILYVDLGKSESHDDISRINEFNQAVHRIGEIEKAKSKVVDKDQLDQLQNERIRGLETARENVVHVYGSSLEHYDVRMRETLADFQQAQTAELDRLNRDTNTRIDDEMKKLRDEMEAQREEFSDRLDTQKAALELSDQKIEALDALVDERLDGLAVDAATLSAEVEVLDERHSDDVMDLQNGMDQRLDELELKQAAAVPSSDVSISSNNCRLIPLKKVQRTLADRVNQSDAPRLAVGEPPVKVDIQFDVHGDIRILPDASKSEERAIDQYVVEMIEGYFTDLHRRTPGKGCRVRVVYART